MLPDFSGTELLVVAAVALIVVGPKDLPVMLRKLGEFMGRMRRMAADFRASFDDMARQSELDDLRKEVEAMRSAAQQQIMEGEAAVREEFGGNFLEAPEPTTAVEAPAAEAPAKPRTPRKRAANKVVEGGPKPRARRKGPAA